MNFATKLAVVMILVISITFSIGGTVLLYNNFTDSLNAQRDINYSMHLEECKKIETDLLDMSSSGEVQLSKSLSKKGFDTLCEKMANREKIAIFCEENYKYFGINDNLQSALLNLQQGNISYLKDGENYYINYKSSLMCGVSAITSYDITSIFVARDKAIQVFVIIQIIVFAFSGIAAYVISKMLTRPLRALTLLSKEIATGDYASRTLIKGTDEVAQLSESFDVMAGAVQSKIQDLNDEIQRKDDFMAAFSHELKTPMTAVIGFADNLRTLKCSEDEQRSAANYIFNEAKRVEGLSQKLLRLLNLQQNDISLREVSVKQAVNDAITAVAPLCGQVHLACDIEEKTVLADKELLTDLLYNLILNSIAASKNGEIVNIQTRELDGKLEVSVIDNGTGIPTAEIEKVKEPFYMVDKARARGLGGSGIGLSLCNKIASLHNTELQIISGLGMGTCVSIELQLVQREAAKC